MYEYKINFFLNIKMVILKEIFVLGLFLLSTSGMHFVPNLPVGEYRILFDAVYPCESTKNHVFKFNFFLNRKTAIVTEIKGNITLLEPLDDVPKFDVNLASWSLTGGWKENSYVYKTDKGCTTFKNIAGKAWFSTIKAFQIPTNKCPIPTGVYVSSGLNIKELEGHNFPKVYFYGKYKGVIKFKNDKNKILGCLTLEMQLVRPWEVPKNY